MTHIKNIIKKNSINNWKECYICEHMFHPNRISDVRYMDCDNAENLYNKLISKQGRYDYYSVFSVCDECD